MIRIRQFIILLAKQIRQNLNKHTSLNNKCAHTKKTKDEKLKYIVKNESAVSFCVILPLCKWAATRSAQIQM